MNQVECLGTAAILAWLHDPLPAEHQSGQTAHLETCPSCQAILEQILEAEERRLAETTGEGLLRDLRRQPPVDDLENEPECALASTRAAVVPSHFLPRNALSPSDPPAAELPARLGHYDILGVLGQGGMGIVYKARNPKLDRLLAIKVPSALKLNNPGVVTRFEREIKAVARLIHPHIVAVYDADEVDGKHFLVMEHLDGVNLSALVKAQGPLPVEKAVRYIVQAARGLQYAHEQGITHRDVKPANLMLTPSSNRVSEEWEGIIKVLDLGLARFESGDEGPTDLTSTGVIMGTVDFMAPEQAANSRNSDGRADIYSLGCSLYYLLTGQSLYTGATVLERVLAHREQRIPALHDACPAAPAALERVFARMVAKRPEDRYPTMAEVIRDLEPVGLALGHSTLRGAVAPPTRPTPANDRPVRRWSPGKCLVLTVTAALALGGICGAMIPLFLNRPGNGGDATGNSSEPALPQLTRGTHAGQEWDGNSLKLKCCWCPPGTFTMGSPPSEPGRTEFESQPVKVVVSRGFWMGRFEVTQQQWKQVMGTTPSRFHSEETLPVENVVWGDTLQFCEALTRQERTRGTLSAEWEFRLPTEAQWEYACRAGTTTAFSFGSTSESPGEHMWYGLNSRLRTHVVGEKKPNPWGLQDMHGNVWEWCRDWFQNQLPGGVDPEVQVVGTGRVIRGGGWNATAPLCRTAFRSGQVPEEAGHLLGFRVALVQVNVP